MIHIMEMIQRLWQTSLHAQAAARILYATRRCGNCGISTMETIARLWQILWRVGTDLTVAVPKVLKVLKVPFPFRPGMWQKVTHVKPT
jgi:hypothetical protein